jgi:anti-sigma factor RsiW
MSQSVDTNPCRFIDERLDAYFDGELGELEHARVVRHLGQCPSCTEALAAFDELRFDLRAAHSQETCPPEVTAAVFEIARREAARRQRPTLRASLRKWFVALLPPPAWRPALAAAAAALLLAVPLWQALRSGAPRPEVSRSAEFDAAELARAEQEARLVLAYVASIGGHAGSKVRQEILNHRIVEPTRRAFGFANGDPTTTEQ